MKQVRPNGVMEDSPLPSPVTSPNHTTDVGVLVDGEEEEPKHRKGVKRNLEDVEGERERESEREVTNPRERERERKMTACYITIGYYPVYM